MVTHLDILLLRCNILIFTGIVCITVFKEVKVKMNIRSVLTSALVLLILL